MSSHIYLFFLIMNLCTGITALVLSSVVFYKNREQFKYYLPIFCILTFNVFSSSAASYLVTNIPGADFHLAVLMFFLAIYSTIFLVALMPLYINHILSISYTRISNIFFILLCIAELFLFFYGFYFHDTIIDIEKKIIEYSLINKVIIFVNITPYAYFIIFGILNLKHLDDSGLRKFVRAFILTLLIFSPGILYSLRIKTESFHLLDDMIENYMFTSSFYLAWSAVSIYYLLRYFLIVHQDPADLALTSRFLTDYGITDREKKVIMLIVNGYSNNDISEDLSISISTVKTHLHNIFSKTGARSRTELISIIMHDR